MSNTSLNSLVSKDIQSLSYFQNITFGLKRYLAVCSWVLVRCLFSLIESKGRVKKMRHTANNRPSRMCMKYSPKRSIVLKTVKNSLTQSKMDKMVKHCQKWLKTVNNGQCAAWCQKCAAWCWKCAGLYQKCVAWRQKFVSLGQKCASWCQKCVSWCHKFASWCQKCVSWCQNCASWCKKMRHGAKNVCHGAENVSQGAENMHQSAKKCAL